MYGQPQPMYQQPMMQPMHQQPMMQPMHQQPMMQPMQPMYQQPMQSPYMPPQQQGHTIIHIDNNNDGVPCQFCGVNTGQIIRRKFGIVACIWAIFLTPLYLCCLPCCMDGCKDQQIVCVKCSQVKKTITANCC